MASNLDDLLSQIDSLSSSYSKDPPLSLPEKILGYGRSIGSGLSLNFEDEIEAAIAAPFTDLTYDQELDKIRKEQARFKEKTNYLDNAVEMGAAYFNPFNLLSKLGKAAGIVAPAIEEGSIISKVLGSPTLKLAATNPVTQGAVSGLGAAEGVEDILPAVGGGALAGAASSAISGTLGSILEKSARQADRLKLSAFGVKAKDVGNQLRKLDNAGAMPETIEKLPLLKTLDELAKNKVISVDDDILVNAGKVAQVQKPIIDIVDTILKKANPKVPISKDIPLPNSEKFINGLTGTAREEAEATLLKELYAIESQMQNGGSLLDLQRAKVGLGKVWDDNPYKPSLYKTLRQDIRQEIENRVAKSGGSSEVLKAANRKWGDLEELKDVFKGQARQDLQGDIVEDAFGQIRTSGGAGSLNIISSTTGSPIPAMLGALGSAVRTNAGKYKLAQMIEEFQTPLSIAGRALPELGKARVGAQAYLGTRETPSIEDLKNNKAIKIEDPNKLKNLLDDLAKLSETKISTNDSLFEEDGKPTLRLLDAIKQVESSGNPNAIGPVIEAGSHKGERAKGAYQFLDSTAKQYGIDPFDEQSARQGAFELLRDNYSATNDPFAAIAAYNRGVGNIKQDISSGRGIQNLEYVFKVLKAAGL